MNDIQLIEDTIFPELRRRFFDIPFGNSAFQNIKFVMEAQYTPERGYRAIGLRLHDRINALNEARFNLRRREVDIAELQDRIKSEDGYSQQRAQIDLEEKEVQLPYLMKLVNDAIIEVATLWAEVQKFPEFTREQFEAAEQGHFEVRLKRQVQGLTGAADSLDLITAHNTEFSKMLEHTKQRLLEDKGP